MNHLRACGIVAGPLFLTMWAVQAFTRDGFDPSRHPLSLLALGDGGWVQITNFVVTGALYVAAAAGLRDHGRWLPRFVATFGLGLILAGVFVTDPGAGYPTGAPEARAPLTWHGLLHELAFAVVQLAWLATAITLAKRTFGLPRRATITTILLTLTIAAWPDPDTLSIRLVIASALQFGLLAVICIRPATAWIEPDARKVEQTGV
ncbi:DUF998 domain-containing protein [Kribbella sp. CA-247076]|uniref:DUF998 domain-containing protein n=1 Tax=Kribbella sp. CA-247076 TaxID=3239941 RepID=UPI003D8F4CEE